MEIVKLYCTRGNKSMHNYSVEVILEAFLYLQHFIHVKKWKNMLFKVFFKVPQIYLCSSIEILCTSLWSKALKSLIDIHYLSCPPNLQSTPPSLPSLLSQQLWHGPELFPFNAKEGKQTDSSLYKLNQGCPNWELSPGSSDSRPLGNPLMTPWNQILTYSFF